VKNIIESLLNSCFSTYSMPGYNFYTAYCIFFDGVLLNNRSIKKSKISGIFSDLASGILQSQENVENKSSESKKVILYTEMLFPNLTKYFDRISGIASNNGGLLSHLSIMARERNIPVIVGFSIFDGEFKLGDYV